MAAVTRPAVVAATPGSSLMTRETVFRLTPASTATSRMVGRVVRKALRSSSPPRLTTLTDNVVSVAPYACGRDVSSAMWPGPTAAGVGWLGSTRFGRPWSLLGAMRRKSTTRVQLTALCAIKCTRRPARLPKCPPFARATRRDDRDGLQQLGGPDRVDVAGQRRLDARSGRRDPAAGGLHDARAGPHGGGHGGGQHG